ncbi:hypothetical protein WN943_021848 [Citrus x changshan-huyou]
MALDSLQRNPLFPNYPFRLPQPNPFLPQKLQDFDYFVVVDFEATCDKKIPHPQEIIEFPSVIVSGVTGQITVCFQIYHMGVTPTNFAVVTWSDWDCQVMLESECRFKNIPKPSYFNRWINLRVPFSKVFGDVRGNLKEAVELAGIVWHGRVHCGLDDSINIASKPAYFNRWINLRVPFSKVFGDVRCNLKEAVELAGIVWHGRVHCGLDDSINIAKAVELVWHGRAHWGLDDSINMARFLAVIMQRGFKFSITKSLTPPQDITQDSMMTWNRHHQFLVRQRKCTFQHTSRDPAEVE